MGIGDDTAGSSSPAAAAASLRRDDKDEDVVDSLTQRMVEAMGSEDHEITTWSQDERTNTVFGEFCFLGAYRVIGVIRLPAGTENGMQYSALTKPSLGYRKQS